MSDEHQDWIQDKTDEDNTRDNLERLQEDGDETSLNTNDEPDDTKSLSSKSKGYTEEALEQIIGGIPVEAIGTMVWNNISPAVKDVIKNKLSKEYNPNHADDGKFSSGGGSSGKKAKDKPKNPYPKSHPKHDDAEKNPNAYGKHQDSHVANYDIKNEDERDFLNKQAKSIKDKGNSKRWEDKGFRVTKDNMGGIDVTKDGKSIWYSQSSEDNVDMFGDSDDWDDNAILDHLESGGAISKEAKLGIPFEDHIKGEATDEESEEASDTGVSPERDYGQKINTPVPSGTTFNESDRKRIKDWHGNTGVEDEDGNVIEDRVLINSLDGESKANEYHQPILIKGRPSKDKLRDKFAPYIYFEDEGENTWVIFDELYDINGKQELESLGYNVIGESKANEEGIASVSGPADSSAIVGTGVHVKPEDDEEVDTTDPVLLNETYVEDQYGYIYRPVYVGESHKVKVTDLIYNGKLYTMESVGNCPMCKGAGKVTVERLGLKECPKCDGSGDIQGEQEQPQMIQQEPPMLQGGESCNCQKKTKVEQAYESFISKKIEILKKRAKGNESVTMMYGLPTIRKNGRKIKGTLAYAGVSLNDRIYLPEELAKGHGKTLPLLLNHSAIAGAENEMDRLDDEMRNSLETETDYNVGEVTLTWDADKLTLYYEGVVENEFFQKEIDDMDMAVSLGIYYDSDSPKVCDEECYTLIKGAEFREVSLVYHAGFPIATIEAVEAKLKKKSAESVTLGHYDEEKKSDEVEDELPLGGTIDAEPKEESVESFYAPQEFSVRGVSGMTISNSNGVEKYTFDPTQNYSTNTIHFNVLGEGATIFGEQLQPKMTTPEELTKEIEAKGDLEVEDSDKDVIAEL